jgi:hypothetical protein
MSSSTCMNNWREWGGFAAMRRKIEYSTSSCGECSWKSSQGSKDFGGKGKNVMEGVTRHEAK